MTGEEVVLKHKKYNLQSWSKQGEIKPIAIEKADGIYMWDYDGNRYTDMSAQLVNLNVGFGNKAIAEAIKEQVDKYCYIAPSYASAPRSELAEMIIDLMPDNMGKVFFTNSQSGAVPECMAGDCGPKGVPGPGCGVPVWILGPVPPAQCVQTVSRCLAGPGKAGCP